jgi:hypothetical protein
MAELATQDAAQQVGEGFASRVTSSFNDVAKVVAGVAGFGVFFFVAGYFIQWQRLKKADLPAQDGLALLPNEQIAAAGVREIFISVLFGAFFLFFLGFALLWLTRFARKRQGRLWRLLSSDALFLGIVLGALTVLLMPLSTAGLIAGFTVVAVLAFGLVTIDRFLDDESKGAADFPLWRIAVAVAIVALVLSVARQREFPETLPAVTVIAKSRPTVEGLYVGSNSDAVLARVQVPGEPAKLAVFERNDVLRFRLQKGDPVNPESESLLGKLGISFVCLPPECLAGEDTRIGPSTVF